MHLPADQLPIEARYKLLTGTVIPRPVAVVSTLSTEGVTNLAPFSYFNIVGHAPLALSFAVAGPKPDGTLKDTLRNAHLPAQGGTGEFVVNIATEHYAVQMARTATPLAVGRSCLVIGEIVYVHIDDALIDGRFRVDFEQLRALGRMAGSRYARTSDTFLLDDENFPPGTR
ncbi:flavin reductase family protein [Hymenobacter terricola]|uniref:flavin reductase family protein n=1 Tax=Hymenobacter terricola TaxID=2819236 RepID=UPI001B3088A5|nr:flavin reductase family protein [Hymenobacter terricola]